MKTGKPIGTALDVLISEAVTGVHCITCINNLLTLRDQAVSACLSVHKDAPFISPSCTSFLFLSTYQDYDPTLRMSHRTLHASLVKFLLALAKRAENVYSDTAAEPDVDLSK